MPLRDILDAVNARRDEPLAYTTILSTTRRLAEDDKGMLIQDMQHRGFGGAHHFAARLSRAAFLPRTVEQIARELHAQADDCQSAAAALAQLPQAR